MKTQYNFTIVFLGLSMLVGCNSGPKVVAPNADVDPSQPSSGIFAPDPATQVTATPDQGLNDEFHTVLVNEVLPTDKYIYLNVTEGGEQFWIATRKQQVKKGETYFYRGGLLKTDYESKDLNKVFDRIYLVSNLVSEDHAQHSGGQLPSNAPVPAPAVAQREVIPTHTDKVVKHLGKVKIADLVKDPKKFEGHSVEISGRCVKTNPNIMDRNWIHLQDGSKDDFDLVVTSTTYVPEGKEVTIRAVVVLDRDFGAGYKYDLILENGTVVQ